MALLLVCVYGGAVFGNQFFKFSVGGVSVIDLVTLLVLAYYTCMFVRTHRGDGALTPSRSCDGLLWAFTTLGVVYVGLSYLGLFDEISAGSVLRDNFYILRQAYYLFFVPLVVLAGRDARAWRSLEFIECHYRFLFVLTYAACVAHGGFSLGVASCFALCFTLLLGAKGRTMAFDWLLLLSVLLAPMATGGEMTQAAIRVLCFTFFLLGEGRNCFRACSAAAVLVVLACYVVPFLDLFSAFGLDANTLWRLEYWRDELDQLLATYGLGVGYGTSYATTAFVGDAVAGGPFGATFEYSVTEKMYVVGCHNSFVSVPFRLGVAGAILLVAALVVLRGSLLADGVAPRRYVGFVFCSAILVVCFNVGFESPTYFFLFAASLAMARCEVALVGALCPSRLAVFSSARRVRWGLGKGGPIVRRVAYSPRTTRKWVRRACGSRS